jgi:filamentous hemagglutinin
VNFSNEAKLTEHFGKHGAEFGAKTADEYLQIGKDIMQRGQKVDYLYNGEVRTGYVQFMGNTSGKPLHPALSLQKPGDAKFGFVGTNKDGAITTIHVESGKDFWKTINGASTDKVTESAALSGVSVRSINSIYLRIRQRIRAQRQ